MATELKLPELGENIEEGNVVGVLVAPGDTIAVDDSLIEIETDKATVEVPATAAGTVEEVRVSVGDTASIGQVLVVLGDGGATAAADAPTAEEPDDTPPPPTSDAATETPAPAKGNAESETKADAPAAAAPPEKRSSARVAASPAVRRLAFEIGVEIAEVPGTGPRGRVSNEDVKRHSKQLHQSRGAAPAAQGAVEKPLPNFSKWGNIETQPMNNIRRVTAEAMSHNWSVIPHVTQFDKADVTSVEAFRQQYKKRVEQDGGKLTLTAILVKVVAVALKEFPQFNSSIDFRNKQIILKDYVSIGVAVDTENGLLVPVIRDVDKKGITEISIELTELSARARDRKLKLDDMQGGTFTISNLGGIGGTAFTPIVNWPEVAILGVARGAHEPVYEDGAFVPRLFMPIALSYDHRVIDGADGARFTRYIDEVMQNPMLLALDN